MTITSLLLALTLLTGTTATVLGTLRWWWWTGLSSPSDSARRRQRWR